jgi:tRNA pseudouridine38-40 synthase
MRMKNVPTFAYSSVGIPTSNVHLRSSGASGRNIRLTLEYDGTNYAGWQTQAKGKKTIQKTIEEILHRILQEKVHLIASGRTDAGVHAKAQVANFTTHSKINIKNLTRALNSLLPKDISVIKAETADLSFHSRFNAKTKIYRYTILNRNYPSALLRNNVHFCPYPLDFKLIVEESKALLGRHNFKSFQATDRIKKNAIRDIKRIKIKKVGDTIFIDIEADGFLKNMVRNIVGTLLEIGRGKLPKGSMKKILVAKDRKKAGPTIEAKGLSLLKVRY